MVAVISSGTDFWKVGGHWCAPIRLAHRKSESRERQTLMPRGAVAKIEVAAWPNNGRSPRSPQRLIGDDRKE